MLNAHALLLYFSALSFVQSVEFLKLLTISRRTAISARNLFRIEPNLRYFLNLQSSDIHSI